MDGVVVVLVMVMAVQGGRAQETRMDPCLAWPLDCPFRDWLEDLLK